MTRETTESMKQQESQKHPIFMKRVMTNIVDHSHCRSWSSGDLSHFHMVTIAMLFVVLQGFLSFWGPNNIRNGDLADSDSYMRLNRVVQLGESRDWHDPRYMRSNAPYGEVLHWTHPLDAYLLLGGDVGEWLGSFGKGLLTAGLFLGPLSHALALGAVVWLGRKLWPSSSVVILAGIFLLQPGITAFFGSASVDHHGLLLTICLWSIGLLWAQSTVPVDWSLTVLAGMLLSLGLWVSTEFLVTVFVCVGFGVCMWLWNPGGLSERWLVVMSTIVVVLCGVLPLERPWESVFAQEFDKVSIVHVALMVLIWSYWLGAYLLPATLFNTVGKRLGYCVVWGLGIVGCMVWVFPKFFYGPMVDIDPQVMGLMWSKIHQVQSLLGEEGHEVGPFIFWLGNGVLAVPYAIWLLWEETDYARRVFWGLILLGLGAFIPLTFYQIRWAGYAEIFLLFPYAAFLFRVAGHMQQALRKERSPLVYGFVIMFGVCWSFFFGLGVISLEAVESRPLHEDICPTKELSKFLNHDPQVNDRSQTIVTYLFSGPEILYRTRHNVLGTPYHRNRDGIVEEYQLLSGIDDAIIQAKVKEREVSLFVICPSSQEEREYYITGGEGNTFYEKLESGSFPQWLAPVALPSELSENFKIFRVLFFS